jgi:hypothetical protein
LFDFDAGKSTMMKYAAIAAIIVIAPSIIKIQRQPDSELTREIWTRPRAKMLANPERAVAVVKKAEILFCSS